MPTVVPSQVVDFLDRRFPYARDWKDGEKGLRVHADRMSVVDATLDLLDTVPDHLLAVDHDDFALLVESRAAMRVAVQVWAGGGQNYLLLPLPDHGGINPLVAVRRVLAKCPDEAPAPGTTELAFIGDEALRAALRVDVSSATQALRNGEWKAATVLAGSVVEALLLWAVDDLDRRDPAAAAAAVSAALGAGNLNAQPRPDRTRWDLAELIPVAKHAGLIGEETAKQCRLAQGFRNLIHPGRAQRLGQACNRGTAYSALAAVEHVVGDLARSLGTLSRSRAPADDGPSPREGLP